jgi:hypothetical protein
MSHSFRRSAALAVALPCLLVFSCTPAATTSEDPPAAGTGGSKATGSGGTPASQGGSGGSGAGGQGGSASGTGGGGGQPSATGGSGGSSSGSGGSPGTGGAAPSGTGGAGSTGPDAGGGADVPASTGAPGCQGFTGKFCSDFEAQTAGGAPNGNGDYAVSGSAITVDDQKAFSGTKSVHFKPGGKNQLVFTKQFPFAEQYGRVMMFVAKTPPNPSHWDIVQSNSGAGNIWSWGGMYGKFELVVDPPDDGKDSSTAIPDGKWICVQWKFSQGTGGKSEYSVKLDGAEVNQSPVIGHWKAGPWKDLRVGFEVFGSAPIEFWIDDLAFGEQAIACPPAK